MPTPFAESRSIVDVVRRRAERHPERRAIAFLGDGERESDSITFAELDHAARVIAAMLQRRGAAGERVLLLYQSGIEFVTALLGSLYAGAIAVPTIPPHPSRAGKPLPRLDAIIADARPRIALCSADLRPMAGTIGAEVAAGVAMEWLCTAGSRVAAADGWREPQLRPETLAFLQYTSGSTGTPKGVMVSHGNLLHNQQLMRGAGQITEESTIVGWTPLYHDQGLVANTLLPLYAGALGVLMPPMAFLTQPLRWLRAISHYRAWISGGPNFGYELCARRATPERLDGLDLSSWRMAYVSAEPVRPATLARFAEAFAPAKFDAKALWPCYGMAEATLLVAANPLGSGASTLACDGDALTRGVAADAPYDAPGVRRLVGAGRALDDWEIRIVHPETRGCCDEDRVGEVWLSGTSAGRGYWGRVEETERTFAAFTSEGEGPFLRTGDLGFLHAGELFLTGRLKDLIIIDGRNHAPQDIEQTAERAHALLRPGGSAAFAIEVDGAERVAVVAELEPHALRLAGSPAGDAALAQVIAAIRGAVAEEQQLPLCAVQLLKPGGLPRTTSGKLQRFACRDGWLAGALPALARWQLDVAAPIDYRPAAEPTPVGAEELT